MSWIIQLILFLLGSGVIVFISRRSLRYPQTHGFYRFFAFEVIWALAVLNFPVWFVDPYSSPQMISWIFLFASIIVLIQGVFYLRKIGRSRGKVNGSANFAFENTTRLVQIGPYRYIRHPMYASLLYLTLGIYFKQWLSIPNLALALAAIWFLRETAIIEEQENLHAFGEEYQLYMSRTKKFIPWLF